MAPDETAKNAFANGEIIADLRRNAKRPEPAL
jgi:hypothetical protein